MFFYLGVQTSGTVIILGRVINRRTSNNVNKKQYLNYTFLYFSEFCGNELNETKFSKYVTHLNANVLYLCFSQNVDPKLLHPDLTLKNLLLLLDTSVSDLGR